MMTLQSDRSEAVHCLDVQAIVHECARVYKKVQKDARLGWGRVYSKRDATLSIFGLPTRYLSIGSVRYI